MLKKYWPFLLIILVIVVFNVSLGDKTKIIGRTDVVINTNREINNSKQNEDTHVDLGTYGELLRLHNIERTKRGLGELSSNPILASYANDWAKVMARKNSLYHSNIDKLLGQFSMVGENIAFNQRSEGEVVEGWMNSERHRENILNKNFTQVGFSVYANSSGKPYWISVFGKN